MRKGWHSLFALFLCGFFEDRQQNQDIGNRRKVICAGVSQKGWARCQRCSQGWGMFQGATRESRIDAPVLLAETLVPFRCSVALGLKCQLPFHLLPCLHLKKTIITEADNPRYHFAIIMAFSLPASPCSWLQHFQLQKKFIAFTFLYIIFSRRLQGYKIGSINFALAKGIQLKIGFLSMKVHLAVVFGV